jgi:hypothetical protein
MLDGMYLARYGVTDWRRRVDDARPQRHHEGR